VSEDFDRAYWEERYRGHAAARHPRSPNPQLVAEAADLVPGRALDAGCGEGADAIWLAARGWRVTAVDISATALRRAREAADALGPGLAGRIDWIETDLTERAPAAAGFDLVSAQYVHPAGPREALFRLLAAAVAPGGTLLVVGHHPSDGHGAGAHAPAAGSHVTAEEVAACLDGDRWDVVVAEARRHTVPGPHGHEITMSDAVLRARRRP
jgi:SAM-dependent methyltransferase